MSNESVACGWSSLRSQDDSGMYYRSLNERINWSLNGFIR